MGLEKESRKRQFGPQDLGILDGQPPKGIRKIVELCSVAVRSPCSGLFVFNDYAGELFLSTSEGIKYETSNLIGLPLTGSIASFVRSENRLTRINDLREPPHDTSVEFLRFGIRAYLGAVVRGPLDEPIGILAAMHKSAHYWTFREAKIVEDMAYLLSQQVMLKASFETLRIISDERKSTTN